MKNLVTAFQRLVFVRALPSPDIEVAHRLWCERTPPRRSTMPRDALGLTVSRKSETNLSFATTVPAKSGSTLFVVARIKSRGLPGEFVSAITASFVVTLGSNGARGVGRAIQQLDGTMRYAAVSAGDRPLVHLLFRRYLGTFDCVSLLCAFGRELWLSGSTRRLPSCRQSTPRG